MHSVEIKRRLLVITLLFTTLADGKRVGRAMGQEALMDDAELKIVSDPLEGFGECSITESGCKPTGWKATYDCGISIKVKATGKTTISIPDVEKPEEWQAALGSFSKSGDNIMEVREMACSPGMLQLFPSACGFFQPQNIAKVCGVETATWVGDKFEVVKEGAVQALTEARKKQEPLDPLGQHLGPLMHIGAHSGCTLKGWTGRYFAMNLLLVLKIEVGGSSTSITSSNIDQVGLPDSLKNLLGSNQSEGRWPNEDIEKKVCEDPDILKAFPDACPFFNSKHLGYLCPLSLGLKNVGKEIEKGGKKLWGKVKGLGWF